uniref:CBL-interacting protein kinase 26-like n=1 Tax=Saccoglossus kowalevskii TaxID=10224 RepID=A0ABM0MSH1_SACKO|nr:PREDICTED: CBL-interacting protein kinase 26-like [Saccoglossus kowalevskii]
MEPLPPASKAPAGILSARDALKEKRKRLEELKKKRNLSLTVPSSEGDSVETKKTPTKTAMIIVESPNIIEHLPVPAATRPVVNFDLDRIQMDKKIGEGNFANIHLAKVKGHLVAIKHHKPPTTASEKLTSHQLKLALLATLSGLQRLHDLGVVHNDFKPSNVLVKIENDGKPSCRIADFGVSVTIGSSDFSGAGTVVYMAPEVICKKPPPCPAKDIWALGCSMAEVVTLQLPHLCGTLVGFIKRIRTDVAVGKVITPINIRHLGRGVYKDLCMACCAMEPSLRPAAGDLINVIRNISPDDIIQKL